MFIGILPECLYVYHMYVVTIKIIRGCQVPEELESQLALSHHVGWESNSSPLQEQSVLLTSEPSLCYLLLTWGFFIMFSLMTALISISTNSVKGFLYLNFHINTSSFWWYHFSCVIWYLVIISYFLFFGDNWFWALLICTHLFSLEKFLFRYFIALFLFWHFWGSHSGPLALLGKCFISELCLLCPSFN